MAHQMMQSEALYRQQPQLDPLLWLRWIATHWQDLTLCMLPRCTGVLGSIER